MPGVPAPRSRRDRPSKAPLSAEAVVDAGLRVLAQEGLGAVTMRRVAAELDTGPASLYVYVANRDELCDAMLDRVVGTIEVEPTDPARWREQVHALMAAMVRVMGEHPGIARVTLGNIPMGENAFRVSEGLLAALRAGGISPQPAAWAVDVLPLIAVANAVEADIYREKGPAVTEESVVRSVSEAFDALSPERFPTLTALKDELVTGDGETRFRFTIDCMLDGLVAASNRQ